MLTITSNNRPRTLLTYWELTPTEQRDFDYARPAETDESAFELDDTINRYDDAEPRFVRAYGSLWDTHW